MLNPISNKIVVKINNSGSCFLSDPDSMLASVLTEVLTAMGHKFPFSKDILSQLNENELESNKDIFPKKINYYLGSTFIMQENILNPGVFRFYSPFISFS
jgi:hypothetical protein